MTRRESAALELLGGGFSNKEIANELYLSVATVNITSSMFSKNQT